MQHTAAGLVGLAAPSLVTGLGGQGRSTPPGPAALGFLDLHRQPDAVAAQTAGGDQRLTPGAGGRWTGNGISVDVIEAADALRIQLSATTGVKRVGLRWAARLDDVRLILGDAWERGYGDL